MRNSCEGVHEIQAISFFMAGCRPNTMLWHKLRRSDPKSMAALMAIADKYALAEEASQANNPPSAPRRDQNKPVEHKPTEGASQGSRRDNYRGKRHSDQPERGGWRKPPPKARPALEAEVHLRADARHPLQVPQREEPRQSLHPRLPLHEAAAQR
jgi:hypothetical protein